MQKKRKFDIMKTKYNRQWEEDTVGWREVCIDEIDRYKCFVSAFHKARFIELFDWAKNEPFFTKEFCKCAFLATWDQDYTNKMKNFIQRLMDERATEVDLKRLDEVKTKRIYQGQENELFKLVYNFLKNPGETPDESCLMHMTKSWIPVGDSALEVSAILDRL